MAVSEHIEVLKSPIYPHHHVAHVPYIFHTSQWNGMAHRTGLWVHGLELNRGELGRRRWVDDDEHTPHWSSKCRSPVNDNKFPFNRIYLKILFLSLLPVHPSRSLLEVLWFLLVSLLLLPFARKKALPILLFLPFLFVVAFEWLCWESYSVLVIFSVILI